MNSIKKIIVLLSFASFACSLAYAQLGDIAPTGGSQCIDLKYNLGVSARDRSTNGEVTTLQEFLQEKGLLASDPTGYFGSQTRAAVMKYQQSVNLIDSGYVGVYTRAAIKKETCDGGTATNSVSKIDRVSIRAASSADSSSIATSGGSVCNSGSIIIEASGLIKSANPKGCMAPAGLACTPREFYADEWRGTTDTVRSTFSGGDYQNGTYDTYLSYPDEEIRKVSTITLKSCSSSGASSASVCGYRDKTTKASVAVFGGTATCTTSIVGNSAPGIPNSECACTSSGGESTTSNSVNNSVKKTSLAKVTVSNSLSGPWLASGASVCNSGKIYIQAEGLTKSSNPKGCMAPAGLACTPREFYADEWGNSTNRIIATANGGDYQNGTYDTYLSYPDEPPTKTGSLTLTACSSSAQTTKVCAYEGVVFGGSPPCTEAIEGQYNGSRCSCVYSTASVSGGSSQASQVRVYGTNSPITGLATNDLTLPVYNTGKIYFITTGISKNSNVKACAVPEGSSDCEKTENYRSFNLATDVWLNDSTVRTVLDGGLISDGTYDFYIMYPNQPKTKVGSITLRPGSSSGSSSTASPSTPSMSVYVSNSPNGPWFRDGAVVNSGTIYVQARGVPKNLNPKGCVVPAGNQDCQNLSNHRAYNLTTDIWIDSTTIQTQVNGGIFPNNSYDSYISFPGGQAIKIGTFKIEAPQSRYEWGCTTFGGSVTPPPAGMCTASAEGTSQNVSGGTCYCNKVSSLVSTQTQIADTSSSKSSATGIALGILENISKQVSTGFAVLNSLSGSSNVSASMILKPATPVNCVSISRNLHRGDESSQTTVLQKFLIDKGYLSEKATGFFGDLTVAAVKDYQKSAGLKETGMVYDLTRASIEAETCQ